MLPKEKRLNRDEFNRFFSVGKKKHTKHFVFVQVERDTFHASVVISKKIYKSAVKRNRLRRQIYDILRRTQKKSDARGVFILVAKPTVVEATPADLKEEIKHIIIRAKS